MLSMSSRKRRGMRRSSSRYFSSVRLNWGNLIAFLPGMIVGTLSALALIYRLGPQYELADKNKALLARSRDEKAGMA